MRKNLPQVSIVNLNLGIGNDPSPLPPSNPKIQLLEISKKIS